VTPARLSQALTVKEFAPHLIQEVITGGVKHRVSTIVTGIVIPAVAVCKSGVATRPYVALRSAGAGNGPGNMS
jgi:hypothetical protein